MSGHGPAGAAATLAMGMGLIGAGWLAVPAAPEAASPDSPRVAVGREYAAGAPPGFSGGFGEPSCHACHFHAEVNTPPGRLVVDGVPAGFVAGGRYAIAITLSRPGMRLAGFQLTARFKDGGAQAGTLVPAAGETERIRVERQGDVHYVSQQEPGAIVPAAGTARWSVEWIAPAYGASVVFHVAANAADADGTVEGDHVHTAVVESAATETPAGAGAPFRPARAMPQVLAAESPAAGQAPRSGAELYMAACANCHGRDGRGVAETNALLPAPVPDFSECAALARASR